MPRPRQNPMLVQLAQERSIPFDENTTNYELSELLGPTPPSPAQITYLTSLAGQELPVKTFGHARMAINNFEDLRNVEVLNRYGWEAGHVLLWKGEHWRVIKVYSHKMNHKTRIELVDLNPDDQGGTRATPVQRVQAQTHNPRTLALDGARTVDMTVWPPVEMPAPADDEPAEEEASPKPASE